MNICPFDIVDAQVHFGLDAASGLLSKMDALGIAAALLYEFWGSFADGDHSRTLPGYATPEGAWRPLNPSAEIAATLHPDRFAYVAKVDRRDPEIAALLRLAKSAPNCRAIRILPVHSAEEEKAFKTGAYEELLGTAADLGLPVFAFLPGAAPLLKPYLDTLPRLQLIVDHCGVLFSHMAGENSDRLGEFAATLELAAYSQVALKWSHAQTQLIPSDPPYAALRPLLRRAIDAFGASRVMWASDHTVIPGHDWSDLLGAVRDDPGLCENERRLLLGGALRAVLKWPNGEPASPLL